MKTKVRLCKLLFSTRLLVSLLIILGILECIHWLKGAGEGFPGSRLEEDYPELSSMKSSSNIHSSSHLPEEASTSSHQVKSNPKKNRAHQNILLLAYARSGNNFEEHNTELSCTVHQGPLSLVNFYQLEPGQLTTMNLSSGGSSIQ